VLAAWLLTYLLHSTVWLGAAWLLLRLYRGAAPPLRERTWWLALAGSLLSPTLALALPAEAPVAAVTVEAPLSELAGPDVAPPGPWLETPVLSDGGDALPAGSLPATDPGPTLPEASLLASGVAPGSSTPPLLERAAALLPALWAAGALGGLLLLLVGHLRVRRRLRARRALDDGPLTRALERMLRPLPRARRVRLTVSGRIPVPVAFGWLRPEICLPERALEGLDAAQQRSMLGHELQHLLRRDPLVLGGLQVLARLLWLQPLNLVALRALRASAEEHCDAWAARRTGDPLAMASCLGEVAGWLMPSRRPLPTACMARPGSPLGHRIHRLLDAPDAAALLPMPRRGERARAGGALLAGVLLGPLVLPAAAPMAAEAAAAPLTLDVLVETAATDTAALVALLGDEAGALSAEIADLERALDARGDTAAQDAARRLAVLRVRLAALHERLAEAGAHFREAPGIPQD
jgi:hypothetical protein